MPPSDTKQNGFLTVSTCLAGSQKPIDRPMVGFVIQLQTGLEGFGMSSCPPILPMSAVPTEIGRMQLQQISVTGLMNLPLQVDELAACTGVTWPSKITTKAK